MCGFLSFQRLLIFFAESPLVYRMCAGPPLALALCLCSRLLSAWALGQSGQEHLHFVFCQVPGYSHRAE